MRSSGNPSIPAVVALRDGGKLIDPVVLAGPLQLDCRKPSILSRRSKIILSPASSLIPGS